MELEDTGLKGASFGVTSFVASSHPAESCGMNGLPLTPHSIEILGASQILLTLNHPNLTRYLDIQRGKHSRILVVSEVWPDSLSSPPAQQDWDSWLLGVASQVLQATAYLHQVNIISLNISRDTIMLDSEGRVKLSGYGLGVMTNYGSWVSFPVSEPRLTAPEVLRQGRREPPRPVEQVEPEELTQILPPPVVPYSCSADSWSLGLTLAALTLDIPKLWPQVSSPAQVVRKVLSLGEAASGSQVLERVAREHGKVGRIACVQQQLLDLITLCLTPCPKERPSPHQILGMEDIFPTPVSPVTYSPPCFPSLSLRCESLPALWPPPPPPGDRDTLEFLTTREIFYLWQLAGGDPSSELLKVGLMSTSPPILCLPLLTTAEGQVLGQPRQRHSLLDTTRVPCSTDQLEACVAKVSLEQLLPLTKREEKDNSGSELPLVIREKDVCYQVSRAVRYRRLLQAYPYSKPNIWSEALIDVVPIYRAQIWASLLAVPHNSSSLYSAIDKDSWNPVDRQIEVDIPRCHQYNELLSSPCGHRKLKRVLKAWVADNPHLVYWQGLDSLAAPFLYLNFNCEALAWACLSRFIPKYLHNMFLKDNAAVIQEYLAKFSHLQAFHDPVLFNHLDSIGFIPDLYCIPWVLTMFSHVFPLHKIFHLWDRLLLGNSSFPLCVGLGVLLQLREQLLQAQFNECILLFSDMPAVDIDQVVSASMSIFRCTPPSLTWREHDCPREEDSSKGDLEMESLPVAVLKSEKVGRISGADLLKLISDSTAKAMVLDVRTAEEFRRGTLPGALNLPLADHETAFIPDAWEGVQVLSDAESKGLVVAVTCSRENMKRGQDVAEALLARNIPRVTLVQGGIEAFRSSGILTVPNT